MEINLGNTEIGGKTRFIVRDKLGAIKVDTGFNQNLLLDSFFKVSDHGSIFAKVGTGTAAPLVTNTDIGSLLGAASASGTTTGGGSVSMSGNNVDGFKMTSPSFIFKWPLGAIVGNVTEYILATSNVTLNTAIVRNLIKDTEGNPTALTLTSNDQLEIWWQQVRQYPGSSSMASATTSYMLNGVATDVTVKQLNPQIFASSQSALIYNKIGPISTSYSGMKLTTKNDAYVSLIKNAAAGAVLSATTTTPDEGNIYPTTVFSNNVSGVAKYTFSATFGLNPNADNAPLQVLSFDMGNTNAAYSFASQVAAALTFNPMFTKGTDKILSVSFSYSVSRAS